MLGVLQMRSLYFMLLTILSHCAFGQSENDCSELRSFLEQIVAKGEKGNNRDYPSFNTYVAPDALGVFSFDELDLQHAARQRYPTIDSLLSDVGLMNKKQYNTSYFFIPEYQLFLIFHEDGDMLFSSLDFRKLISFEGIRGKMRYLGAGFFYSMQHDRSLIFRIKLEQDQPTMSMLLNKTESLITPFHTGPHDPNKYFLVKPIQKRDGLSLYDPYGKILFEGQDVIRINPGIGMVILQTGATFKLVDVNNNIVVGGAQSITEIGKSKHMHYLVYTKDRKHLLIDPVGEVRLCCRGNLNWN